MTTALTATATLLAFGIRLPINLSFAQQQALPRSLLVTVSLDKLRALHALQKSAELQPVQRPEPPVFQMTDAFHDDGIQNP